MTAELPSGTVTFLFSDIEGSTPLLQRLGDRWGAVVATHNRILREAFAEAGGREVDRQGDAFFAVFPRARNALAAAATAQRALAAHDWPDGAELRVRMGVHTGEPALGEEGYLGLDVVRAARICSLARGAQVLVSESTRALARGDLGELELRDVGEHHLKGLDEPERLYQLVGPGLADVGPPGAPSGLELPVAAASELAGQALERLRELELGPLVTLGPRIETQVQRVLREAGVDQERRTGDAAREARDPLSPVSPERNRVLRVAVAAALAVLVLAILVVVLAAVL